MAESQGYVSPAEAVALRERLVRTEADLDALRRERPDLKAEVDRAILAVNEGDRAAARAAFADANAAMDAREAAQRLERAQLKNAEATLLYPFEASKAEPLLTEAAELAQANAWYWIECGRARIALGSLGRALAAFEAAERVARTEHLPDDLAAALEGIGDVRRARGDLPGALAAYDEGLKICRDLAARDPGNAGWARDVSVSLERVGDVRRDQSDLPGALAAYDEGLRIRRDLAARDPGSAGWARDVSIGLHKVGDVRRDQGDLLDALAAYDESLRIGRDLAARGPGNAGWARDASVSLNKVGDVRRDQGDLPGALAAYDQGLKIRRDLAARDPGNAGWARDLSVSLYRIGRIRLDQGDLPGALAAYDEGLRIARHLADRDPGNATWARDVAVSYWRLAEADPANAPAHWAEVVARMEDMAARGILLPGDAPYLDAARRNLAGAGGREP